jgi:CRISPR system Cascade subunit CasE
VYLSRLQLGVATRTAQHVLHDPYRLHQALLRAFPPDAPGGGGRVLFRVEPRTDEGLATIIVQSALPADWSAAGERAKLQWRRVDGPKEVALALRVGLRLRFRLRANPTRKTKDKRLAVVGEAEQLAWLGRKLAQGGFTLSTASANDEGMIQGRRGRDSAPMTFVSVLYEGVALVADEAKARATIEAGIGTAKAFGFGLLSVAKAG